MSGLVERDKGLLLVGHGTRNTAGLAEFSELAQLVEQAVPVYKLQPAFLELATPDIASGIEQLVAQSVTEIVVVPVLLFAAGHSKRDIPLAIEQAVAKYPGILFRMSSALECHPRLLELSKQRFQETTTAADVHPRDVNLLVVGRGSTDEDATQNMQHYAATLADHVEVPVHRVAFMAMAKPSFREALDEMTVPAGGAIVVQPHLLFRGELLDELRSYVLSTSRSRPDGRILITSHLGPEVLLAAALADLAEKACLQGNS